MISEPADAAVCSLKQMNSIPEGALLAGSASAGSQSLLACSLLPSKADLYSLGTAAETFCCDHHRGVCGSVGEGYSGTGAVLV